MTFSDKIKTGIFWKNTIRISIMFFVILIIFSLLINSFTDILNFDIDAIKAKNFSEGNWRRFFFSKIIIAVLYGMWVTNRNMK
jgi:hypothetical protein